MLVASWFFLTSLAFGESVFVTPRSINIENSIYMRVEEPEEGEEGSETDEASQRRLRESVSERLSFGPRTRGDFRFSTEVESYLSDRQQIGGRYYIVESDLKASFTEANSASPFDEERVGRLSYNLQAERGNESTRYRYIGYIDHIDGFSTNLGLEYNIVRSRDFSLCSLDDDASVKLESLQGELELSGSYDANVYCVLTDNLEQGLEAFFLLSSEQNDLVEIIDVENEFIISLGEALVIRHQMSFKNGEQSDFNFNNFNPQDFQTPNFIFNSGPRVGDFRLERFNERLGSNHEVSIELENQNGECTNTSTFAFGVFTPLNEDQSHSIWEVSLDRSCVLGEGQTRSFELSFGNNYAKRERGSFSFFGLGSASGSASDSSISSGDSSSQTPQDPINVISLSYSIKSETIENSFSLNMADIEDLWTYDLLYQRSIEYKSEDRFDLDFRIVFSEDDEQDTFFYTGFNYFSANNWSLGSGLTTDFEDNYYLTLSGSSEPRGGSLTLDWTWGRPLSGSGVQNQGPGLDTEEPFFQMGFGTAECESFESLCWRGAFERIGDTNQISFGGFIEF